MATSYINDMQKIKIEELSWNQLQHASLAMDVPFLLPLGEQDEPVFCDRIVRAIPKKRLVAFGLWNEQPVAVKIFYGSGKAKRHYEQEIAGVEDLVTCGVPTPRLLFKGCSYKKRAYILVFEQITDAHTLDELWRNKTDPEELSTMMHAVTIELATQHVLGIVQRDLHFKNFLLKGNQIYTLDGASIDFFHELLLKKPSLDHLGLFFAQLGVGSETLQQALFQTYANARGWLVKRADIHFLHTSIRKWQEQRRVNYQQKIQRNCSAFARMKRFFSVGMYDRSYSSPMFQQFLTDPENMFSHPATQILKAGRSSTVFKIQLDGKQLVVKRYNIKGLWHWLRRTLRPTRAAKSWRLANTLCLFGVPTAKPIAFIEKRFFGLRHTSYFVMEYVDAPNLADYMAKSPNETVAARVIALLKNIIRLRMSHGDLKATNILVENEHPLLLDLDGMTEYKNQHKANRAYKRELKRFMQNWEHKPAIKGMFEKLL